VADPPIANTSPLIVLAQGGRLDLLRVAGEQILIPRAVEREVRRFDLPDATKKVIVETPWLKVVDSGPVPPIISGLGLDHGEEAVLAWALAHSGTLAIIDDRRGRRAATAIGVPVVGTLGLILEAKRRAIIPAARPVVEHLLRTTDWYLSASFREQALARVGE
jgi:predicted nucleic acid-binding protein